MDQHRNSPNTPGPQDLSDLARDLAALGSRRIEVPTDIDDAVMAAARSALSERRRGKFAARRWAGWTAAAAGLALVVWGGSVLTTRRPVETRYLSSQLASAPGDLDRSGRVDILDAFALARQLDSDIAPTLGDFNGDGRIDRADVDAIAMAAVRLTEGTS